MDTQIRLAAFEWLKEMVTLYDDVLPRNLLESGFKFKNETISLIGPKGIWKPRIMELPISITTSPNSPYDDGFTEEMFLKYRYRGTDPYHSDNVGLRELMQRNKPLIFFHGILPGKYLATWPVYIIKDSIQDLTFTIAIDDAKRIDIGEPLVVNEGTPEYYKKAYKTGEILIRLHQRSFRERVLRAYRNQCSLCQLRHSELLDAAHIIGDRDDLGDPIVQNGISLCKIHHAAYDKNILGISPDYIIKVRTDVLEEIDGPMLKYGIQSLNSKRIILPRRSDDWPDQERLQIRYENFLKAV